MKEFLEGIQNNYFNFIHFKQEQDEEIERLKQEKRTVELRLKKEGIDSNEDYENLIKKAENKIDKEIEVIMQQIKEKRKQLEDIFDERIEVESNVIESILKSMEEKVNEIKENESKTKQDIKNVEEIDDEELIDLKKETIKRLSDKFDEIKSKMEKEYYGLKELYTKHQDNLKILKELKQCLYKDYKGIEINLKKEVAKPSDKQELIVDENNQENEKSNYEERRTKNRKTNKKENVLTKLIRLIRLIRNKRIEEVNDEPMWAKDSNGQWYLKNPPKISSKKERESLNERLQNGVRTLQTIPNIPLQEQKDPKDSREEK